MSALVPKQRPAQVYMRNIEAGDLVVVTEEEILEGVMFVECPECDGTTIFKITETDSQPCNFCKGSGLMAVNC